MNDQRHIPLSADLKNTDTSQNVDIVLKLSTDAHKICPLLFTKHRFPSVSFHWQSRILRGNIKTITAPSGGILEVPPRNRWAWITSRRSSSDSWGNRGHASEGVACSSRRPVWTRASRQVSLRTKKEINVSEQQQQQFFF